VLECEVDTSRDEGRADDKTADLDLEAELREDVVVKHDSTNVTNHLS
jgi:hypothetical protein